VSDGILLTVRLTPKGGRDAIDGAETLADGTVVLKARVRALPLEGEANAALVRLIAASLNVAPRAVTLTAGSTSRIKRLRIEGRTEGLIAALEKDFGARVAASTSQKIAPSGAKA
jgi:uncharacterized protein YggU (UPF0235/DUF167 family)